MKITQNDILDAIRTAIAKQPPVTGEAAVTTDEYAKATGKSRMAARKEIAALIAAGLLVPVRVPRQSMAGTGCVVPAYRPK